MDNRYKIATIQILYDTTNRKLILLHPKIKHSFRLYSGRPTNSFSKISAIFPGLDHSAKSRVGIHEKVYGNVAATLGKPSTEKQRTTIVILKSTALTGAVFY